MQDPAPAAELLDIGEAAALLRVSETSLRRWTNAGRLPCLRIGGRRERRFRRSDLLAFVAAEQSPPTPPSRHHYCGFYTSDPSRARAAAGFLDGGLRSGALALLMATKTVQQAVAGMLRPYAKTGTLVLAEYRASVTAQLTFLRARLQRAGREQFQRVYAVGDVSSGAVGGLPFAKVLEYETALSRFILPSFPVAILCLYDARQVSGLDVAELLKRHDGGAHAGYRSER